MMTEAAIKAAIRNAPHSGKSQITLKDKGPRGAGRLALIVRPGAARVSAEWYAIYFRGGDRRLAKVGDYPSLSLAGARELFRNEFAPAILAGSDPGSKAARAAWSKRRQDITVRGLFEGYVAHLKERGAASWADVERKLLKCKDNAADALGSGRAAASVKPAEIAGYLGGIYRSGRAALAVQVRAYMCAAWNWGRTAQNDCTSEEVACEWGLKGNPVEDVPIAEAGRRVGSRVLKPSELRAFWLWCERKPSSKFSRAFMLEMATGQRITEILRMREDGLDMGEQVYEWTKTKNRLPHAIPLPRQAVAILRDMRPSLHGWFFPAKGDKTKPATKPASYHGADKLIELYLEETGAAHFTPRDLRRTWKTLAGRAGVSKDVRDRLQNHVKGDVSSKHYDRYDYMPEKRAGMRQWEAFLGDILAGKVE